MHDQPGNGRLDIEHLDFGASAVGLDDARIGKLASALRVEGRAVEHDLDLGARTRRWHRRTADKEPDYGRLADGLVITGEGDPAGAVEQLAEDRDIDVPVRLRAASSLARLRCWPMSLRNPSSSTVRPCSAAISRVSSIGNPYVSCN